MHRIFKATTTGASRPVHPSSVSESRFDNHSCEGEAALTRPILFPSRKASSPECFSAESSRVSFRSFLKVRIYSTPRREYFSPVRISPGIAESRCWLSNPPLDPVPKAERRINNIDIARARAKGQSLSLPRYGDPIPELNVVMRDNRGWKMLPFNYILQEALGINRILRRDRRKLLVGWLVEKPILGTCWYFCSSDALIFPWTCAPGKSWISIGYRFMYAEIWISTILHLQTFPSFIFMRLNLRGTFWNSETLRFLPRFSEQSEYVDHAQVFEVKPFYLISWIFKISECLSSLVSIHF